MSQDLYENLQDLLDHTALEAGATAGYLGKVVHPIKGFKDGLSEHADEDAHIIEGAEQHIEWQYTTNEFDFLKDKILH